MKNKTTVKWLQRLPVYSAVGAFVMSVVLSLSDGGFVDGRVTVWVRVLFEVATVTGGFYLIHRLSSFAQMCVTQRTAIFYTYSVFVCLWVRRWAEHMMVGHLRELHVTFMVIGALYVVGAGILIRKAR